MKTFMIAAASVVAGAFVLPSASFADSVKYDNVCASERDNGWVVTGIPSTMRDWPMTQVIGSSIGDGNCQDGWVMNSTVDPRIQGVASTGSTNTETSSVSTLTGTSVNVVTNAAGRITASWQGFAPERLKGLPISKGGRGDKWKLISSDGTNHTYKLVKRGNHPWPKGSTYVFTDQAIIDRDYLGGTSTKPNDAAWNDKLRYGASRDTTTTVQNFDVETTKTVTYTKTRTFCPSVWTYSFVAPNGDAAGSVQGNVGECVDERVTVTRQSVSGSTRSSTNIKVGDKYVTTQ